MDKTTIQLSSETLERLKMFKQHQRESYEEVLNNLMDESGEEELSADEIDEIKISLEEVKQGKTKPIEQVAKELGVSLV
jgi:predicted transcriptional regulator